MGSEEVGRKFDGEKPRMYLLPPKALTEVGKVLTFGAQKYDEENWKKVDNLQKRYSSAAIRHIFALLDGEELDPETNLSHEAHAICCLLFMLEAKLDGKKRSEEEGLRKSVSFEYRQSDKDDDSFGYSTAYLQEGGMQYPEYSVQYDALAEHNRRALREKRVRQEKESSE